MAWKPVYWSTRAVVVPPPTMTDGSVMSRIGPKLRNGTVAMMVCSGVRGTGFTSLGVPLFGSFTRYTVDSMTTGCFTPSDSMQARLPVSAQLGPTVSVSWKTSLTSIGLVVAPQVMCSFWPRITPGAPGKPTPLTFIGPLVGSSSTTRCHS